jgi:hypothetical protein
LISFQGCKNGFDISKSISVIQYTNRIRDKNLMIISIDAKKVFDTIQNAFMMKTVSKVGVERTYPQYNKGCI